MKRLFPNIALAEEEDAKVLEAEKEKARIASLKKSSVEAWQLMALYEANEVTADQAKGQEIVLHGTVGKIAKDILGSAYITLDERPYKLGSVQAMFTRASESQLIDFVPGKKVYIKGTLKGKLMNVLLRDCSILQ